MKERGDEGAKAASQAAEITRPQKQKHGYDDLVESWKTKAEALGFNEQVFKENQQKAQEEFGDLLFALVNLARKNGLNPDDALEYTNQKFQKRFMFIEEKAKEAGRNLTDMSLEEMDAIWNQAKTNPNQ